MLIITLRVPRTLPEALLHGYFANPYVPGTARRTVGITLRGGKPILALVETGNLLNSQLQIASIGTTFPSVPLGSLEMRAADAKLACWD